MKENIKKHDPIGRRIRAFRQNRGLNISELAKKANMSRSYLSQLELEDVDNPTVDTIRKIANGLDITASELIGEKTPQKESDTSSFKFFFDKEELEEMFSDKETLEGLKTLKEILTDPKIPIQQIDDIREKIVSYGEWLQEKAKKRSEKSRS